MPRDDSEFKRAYVAVASAAGLTNDQVVRIYSFEATGNGNSDIQAGLEFTTRARALSTAPHPSHAERAQALAGPERIRIWRLYLRAGRRGFENGFTSIFQVVAHRP